MADLPKIVSTQGELAKLLGTTPKTVWEWARLPNAPTPTPGGKHRVAEWVAFADAIKRFGRATVARGDHLDKNLPDTSPSKKAPQQSEQARLEEEITKEKLIKLRIENQESMGSLVPAGDIVDLLSKLVSQADIALKRSETEMALEAEGKSRTEIEILHKKYNDKVRSILSNLKLDEAQGT